MSCAPSADSQVRYLNPDTLELTAQHVETATIINPVYFLWVTGENWIITSDDPAATEAFSPKDIMTQVVSFPRFQQGPPRCN